MIMGGSDEPKVDHPTQKPVALYEAPITNHGGYRALAGLHTRVALRGKPAETVEAGVRRVLRATIFRFELVMRINVVTHEFIDREALIHAVLTGMLGMLTSDDRPERLTEPSYRSRLAQCRDVTAGRVEELLAAQEARSIAEKRYLEGYAALFPDDLRDWAERLQLAKESAVMADRVAELDGLDPAPSTAPGALHARAAQLAADLIEPSRASALDKLDEGRRGLEIATAWLRSKTASPISGAGDPTLEPATR
jgi:hypothetical protein